MRNVITAKQLNMIAISHHANQSSPSVILIAFTTATVAMNVRIGKRIQTSIFQAIGQKLI